MTFYFILTGIIPEGDLTKTRASWYASLPWHSAPEQIQLGDYLLLGKGRGGYRRKAQGFGRFLTRLEALIGAIYLDGGFANAKEFILRFILNDIEHKQLFYDSKTILQEMVQSQYEEPLSLSAAEGRRPGS